GEVQRRLPGLHRVVHVLGDPVLGRHLVQPGTHVRPHGPQAVRMNQDEVHQFPVCILSGTHVPGEPQATQDQPNTTYRAPGAPSSAGSRLRTKSPRSHSPAVGAATSALVTAAMRPSLDWLTCVTS